MQSVFTILLNPLLSLFAFILTSDPSLPASLLISPYSPRLSVPSSPISFISSLLHTAFSLLLLSKSPGLIVSLSHLIPSLRLKVSLSTSHVPRFFPLLFAPCALLHALNSSPFTINCFMMNAKSFLKYRLCYKMLITFNLLNLYYY